jgi:hypothetical protein
MLIDEIRLAGEQPSPKTPLPYLPNSTKNADRGAGGSLTTAHGCKAWIPTPTAGGFAWLPPER